VDQKLEGSIKEYSSLVQEFGRSCDSNAWQGTFLHTKDRFHSPFLKTYLIFKKTGKIESPFLSITNFLFIFLSKFIKWHYYLLRSLYLIIRANQIWQRSLLSPVTGDINLIKSFYYDRSFKKNRFIDDFFPGLEDALRANNEEVITLVDPLNSPVASFKNLQSTQNVIPFYILNNAFDLISIYIEIIRSFFTPPTGSPIRGEYRFREIMVRQYRCDIFNPILLQGLLLSKSMERLLKDYKIKRVYLTYENLNWEKSFIKTIKGKSPQTTIIGFQHAVVPLSCTNYFLAKNEENETPIPDTIITNGSVTRNIMKKYGHYDKTPILIGAALRQSHILTLPVLERNHQKNILIALEGNLESLACVQLILSQIESLKGWKITIRNHPILPIEKCEKYLNVKFDSFPNISISKNTSLHDDIKNCAIILYWGTTVSLEALAMGRPIIHYHQGDLVNYDPVFELSTFKEVICRNDPLLPILNKYLNLSDTEYLEKSKIAIDYVNQYFYPVNKETIKKFTAL